MHILYFWLAAVNIIGVIVTVHDKRAARHGAWRVSEHTLFVLCFAGGCPGVYLTMRLIHHKILHKRFMLGIPLIFALQCVICGLIYYFIFS